MPQHSPPAGPPRPAPIAGLAFPAASWMTAGAGQVRSQAPLRVLILEDDSIIAMLLTTILERMGHVVIGTEATEAGAVAAAARDRPGLILADDRLRIGSGRGALGRILGDGFIPHIHMSGNRVDASRFGPGEGALQKPFSVKDIEAAITKVMRPADA